MNYIDGGLASHLRMQNNLFVRLSDETTYWLRGAESPWLEAF